MCFVLICCTQASHSKRTEMKSLSCVLLLSLAFALSLSCVLLPALAATPSGDDAPVPKSSIARAEIMVRNNNTTQHNTADESSRTLRGQQHTTQKRRTHNTQLDSSA